MLIYSTITNKRHAPATRHRSKVGIQIHERVHDAWHGHDLVDGGAARGVKVKHAQDEVTEVVAVVVGDGRERAAHDLEDQRWEGLQYCEK